MDILQTIIKKHHQRIKQLGILIDPDKYDPDNLKNTAEVAEVSGVDYFLVGGSLLTKYNMGSCIDIIKGQCNLPVLIFPGSMMQVEAGADALLMLSLISGRNPEMLIGNHVVAAPLIRQSGLEIIPTGYMLIESGKTTSVLYMSNTIPIPNDKTDIAFCTAMAGEMLGMQLIFMDAGSGASNHVPIEMVHAVRQNISLPLVVGGGIRTAEAAKEIWEAGADLIIIGNAAETRPEVIREAANAKQLMNKAHDL